MPALWIGNFAISAFTEIKCVHNEKRNKMKVKHEQRRRLLKFKFNEGSWAGRWNSEEKTEEME